MWMSRPRALLRIGRLGAANAGEVDVSRRPSCERGRPAADKDRLHREALIPEKTFGDGDAERQLVVPGKADKDDAEIFLFLCRKPTRLQQEQARRKKESKSNLVIVSCLMNSRLQRGMLQSIRVSVYFPILP